MTVAEFRSYFEQRQYQVVEIKVTEVFELFEKYIVPDLPLVKRGNERERYETYIAYGNQLREKFGDALLAATAIRRIIRERLRLAKGKRNPNSLVGQSICYINSNAKRKSIFCIIGGVFQVSIYSRRGVRVDFLSRKFAHNDHMATAQNYRDAAEGLIKRDENEIEVDHGQRVAEIFMMPTSSSASMPPTP